MGCFCTRNYVCSWCTYGLGGKYVCNDPQCCPPDYDATDARWAKVREQQEAARLKRELEYEERIASLPKKAGAIRMFRTWKLTASGELKAMVANHTWKPGENVSLASGGDAQKDSGFYGFAGLGELQRQEAKWWELSQSGKPGGSMRVNMYGDPIGQGELHWYVCGTTLCYGHVKVSEKGGRAQKAVPEYIIEPDGSDPSFGMLVVNAAEKYGMKIITVAQAEELATGLVPWWPGRKS